MNKLYLFFIIGFLFSSSICNARQLSQSEIDYYNNLRNCTQSQNGIFRVYGFEGNACKVTMTQQISPDNPDDALVYTYKIPQNFLNEMCDDAQNLSEVDFKAKWEPKEEGFCTLIKYKEKIIHSK